MVATVGPNNFSGFFPRSCECRWALFDSMFLDTHIFYMMDRQRTFFEIWFHKTETNIGFYVQSFSAYLLLFYATLCYAISGLWDLYAMRNWNEELNDIVCNKTTWLILTFVWSVLISMCDKTLTGHLSLFKKEPNMKATGITFSSKIKILVCYIQNHPNRIFEIKISI